jgi:2-alkenal reductase
MNTMIFSPSGVSADIGLAVPINHIKRVVPALIRTGRYIYPWPGIAGRDFQPEDVDAMDLTIGRGALVVEVTPDSPADRAGLCGSDSIIVVDGEELTTGGDVIVAIDHRPVHDMDYLVRHMVKNTRPDSDIILSVVRDGMEMSIPVTLGERTDDPKGWYCGAASAVSVPPKCHARRSLQG